MQIAQNLMPHGMAAHNDFKDAIRFGLSRLTQGITRLLESGTGTHPLTSCLVYLLAAATFPLLLLSMSLITLLLITSIIIESYFINRK